jgi:hypothetical protein
MSAQDFKPKGNEDSAWAIFQTSTNLTSATSLMLGKWRFGFFLAAFV